MTDTGDMDGLSPAHNVPRLSISIQMVARDVHLAQRNGSNSESFWQGG